MMALYKSNEQEIDTRVADLLKQMTLEEKVGQMVLLRADNEEFQDNLEKWHVGSYFHIPEKDFTSLQDRAANTRLGIPLLFAVDAIHGHCFENNATVFPTQLALSSSWDESLLEDVAHITAKETRATGIHWTFSPVLCLGRDTRWGRVGETFGEDPHLSAALSLSMIKAYQGEDLSSDDSILACAKHYVGYGDALGGRDSYEATLSKRQLLSLFLPPFEKAVKETNVGTLMAGYHSIDGRPCSANKWLMQDIAKDTWKMDGFIVTDYDNIGAMHSSQKVSSDLKEAAYMGIVAGNDMIMNTPSFYEHAIELVREGRIEESRIDDSVARILRYKFKLGLFDGKAHVDLEKRNLVIGQEDHWQKALEASRKSVTLLKNNNVLPLNSAALNNLLVVGSNADDKVAQLGDWSFGPDSTRLDFHDQETVTLLQALQSKGAAENVNVNYVRGATCGDDAFDEIAEAIAAAQQADAIIACVGDTLVENGEFHDRAKLDLTGKQSALLEAMKATGKPLIVVYMASKPLAISWIKDNADALVCGFNPGAKGGIALTEALFGDFNPSGKLSITFPQSVGQLPVHYNSYAGWHASFCDSLKEERYIDQPKEPVFSFGYGLSYTEFAYSDLTLLTPVLTLTSSDNNTLRVSVTVTNTGQQAGTEIVQLYINDIFSSVTTPIMELKDFKRVELAAGESQQVTFELDLQSFSLVNTELERIVEAGEFEVMVGSSSRRDDLLTTTFKVEA